MRFIGFLTSLSCVLPSILHADPDLDDLVARAFPSDIAAIQKTVGSVTVTGIAPEVDLLRVRTADDTDRVFSLPGLHPLIDAPQTDGSKRWADFVGRAQENGFADPQWYLNALEHASGQDGGTLEFAGYPSAEVVDRARAEFEAEFGGRVQLRPVPAQISANGLVYTSYDVVTAQGLHTVGVIQASRNGDLRVQYDHDVVVTSRKKTDDINIDLNGTFATGLKTSNACLAENDRILPKSCFRQAFALTRHSGKAAKASAIWIGGKYVLTADHVSKGTPWKQFEVFSGHNLQQHAAEKSVFQVEDSRRLEIGEKKLDAVVLKLDRTPEWYDADGNALSPPPQLLFLSEDQREDLSRARLFGAGFGVSHTGRPKGQRASGELRLECLSYAQDECSSSRLYALSATFLKSRTRSSESKPCDSDSGSPLMVQLTTAEQTEVAVVGMFLSGAGGACVDKIGEFLDLTHPAVQAQIIDEIRQMGEHNYPDLAKSPGDAKLDHEFALVASGVAFIKPASR